MTVNYSVDPSMGYDDKKSLRKQVAAQPVSYADQFATGTLPGQGGPSYAAGCNNNTAPLVANAAATAAPIAAPTPAQAAQAAAAAAPQFQNAPAGPVALTNGVRRYNIGGQVGGPNAAQVYTARGKDGSIIFTDNANFAEQNSAGGLNRSVDAAQPGDGTNQGQVYENSQGPRAGFQYAQSQLAGPQADGRTPLNSQAIMGLQGDDVNTAYARAQQYAAGASRNAHGTPNTDQGLADDITLNQLRARKFTQDNPAGGGAGAGGNIPVAQQIALMRAKATQDYQQGRLAQGQGQLAVAQSNSDTQKANSERQAAGDTFKQYQAQQANDPRGAASFLAGKLQSGITQDPKGYLDTPEGQMVSNTYLTQVLQPGAQRGYKNSPVWTWGDKSRAANTLGYGNLNLSTSGFDGMRRPSDDPNGDVSYPKTDNSLLGMVEGSVNYDPSVSMLSPATWKILQARGNKGG